MEIIFYSTHCPRCKVLEMKLKQKNLSYTEETDTDVMASLGIKSAPTLSVDGTILHFKEALDWIKDYKEEP